MGADKCPCCLSDAVQVTQHTDYTMGSYPNVLIHAWADVCANQACKRTVQRCFSAEAPAGYVWEVRGEGRYIAVKGQP